MTNIQFSKKEAIQYGWATMKKNFWFFVGILLIVAIINGLPEIISKTSSDDIPAPLLFLISLISLVFFLLKRVVEMGQIKISLKIFDNQKPEIKDLFGDLKRFIEYLIGVALYGILVIVGVVLLVFPGIIWAIKYMFVPFLIIDKNMHPLDAFKKSAAMTKGNKWNLLMFDLLSAGIIILGALCLVVGLFAAIPTVMMATVFIYRKLLTRVEGTQSEVVEAKKI